MDFNCKLDLNRNSLKSYRLKEDTEAPASAKPGRVLFRGGKMSICKAAPAGVANWLPLTNQAEANQYVQTTASDTWTYKHGHANGVTVVQVIDDAGAVLTPTLVDATVAKQITLHFDAPHKGKLVVANIVEGQAATGGGTNTDPPPVVHVPTYTLSGSSTPKSAVKTQPVSFGVSFVNRFSFQEDVDFSVTGAPAGTAVDIFPASTKASKAVSVTVTPGADDDVGSYELTFTAVSRVTNLTKTVVLNLVVTEPVVASLAFEPVDLVFNPSVPTDRWADGFASSGIGLYPEDSYPDAAASGSYGYIRWDNLMSKIGGAPNLVNTEFAGPRQDDLWEILDAPSGLLPKFIDFRALLTPESFNNGEAYRNKNLDEGILSDSISYHYTGMEYYDSMNMGFLIKTNATCPAGDHTFKIRLTTHALNYHGETLTFVNEFSVTVKTLKEIEWSNTDWDNSLDNWQPSTFVHSLSSVAGTVFNGTGAKSLIELAPNKFVAGLSTGLAILDYDPVTDTFAPAAFSYSAINGYAYEYATIDPLGNDLYFVRSGIGRDFAATTNRIGVFKITPTEITMLRHPTTSFYAMNWFKHYESVYSPEMVAVSSSIFVSLANNSFIDQYKLMGSGTINTNDVSIRVMYDIGTKASFAGLVGRAMSDVKSYALGMVKAANNIAYTAEMVFGRPSAPAFADEMVSAVVMSKIDFSTGVPVRVANSATLITSPHSVASATLDMSYESGQFNKVVKTPDGNSIFILMNAAEYAALGVMPASSVLMVNISSGTPVPSSIVQVADMGVNFVDAVEWIDNTHVLISGVRSYNASVLRRNVPLFVLTVGSAGVTHINVTSERFSEQYLLTNAGAALGFTHPYELRDAYSTYHNLGNGKMARFIANKTNPAVGMAVVEKYS